MPNENTVPPDFREEHDPADKEAVERERAEAAKFVAGLSIDDIRSGGWFTKLCAQALKSYTEKVDWRYFEERYRGVPPDAIVDQRIKMAVRYAAIEGGLSASAYTGAVAATIGTLGGGSPVTVPAAVTTFAVDLVYLTRLQMHLAYDISVLYRVPLDLSDPDDMWKLIRVALTIKSGELAREGTLKAVPLAVRPLIKKFYSGHVLHAAKALPVVGKYLLQRNVIKIGIPAVGIPLAVLVNRYTTQVVGRHARGVFRNQARVIEIARGLSEQAVHPRSTLWVAWLVIMADGKISDDEALLMRHLVRLVRDQHDVTDEDLADLIDLSPDDVWVRIDEELGDLRDLLRAAETVAAVDGPPNAREREVVAELDARLRLREESRAAADRDPSA